MFYSVLTLHFDPGSSEFAEGPLEEFSKSREVLCVREHFFGTHGAALTPSAEGNTVASAGGGNERGTVSAI